MRTIIIHNTRFGIQAFDKDNFFNLTEIDNGDIPFDKKLGCLKFDLTQNKDIIYHNSKNSAYAMDFISKINIQEVIAEVYAICEKK